MDPTAPISGPDEVARIDRQRRFIRAMSKSIEGQPLEPSERTLLEKIFAALIRGADVSDLTGIRRPRAQRSSDPIHVALHYLCLTRLMDTQPEAAWDMIGAAWGLNRREVQRLIVENRKPALAALPRFAADPARLLSICERHARGARPTFEPSPPAASAPASGDALLRMLARLTQHAAVDQETVQ